MKVGEADPTECPKPTNSKLVKEKIRRALTIKSESMCMNIEKDWQQIINNSFNDGFMSNRCCIFQGNEETF